MKISTRLIAALAVASTSFASALAKQEKVPVVYEIDVKGTGNIPKEAYDALYADPEGPLKAIADAFPGTVFFGPGQPVVLPDAGRRGLLRGGSPNESANHRDLQIRICRTLCSASVVTVSTETAENTGARRELFEASFPPSAVNGLEKALSLTLSTRMCGRLQGCGVKVKLEQVY
jgi:hypothetical protein